MFPQFSGYFWRGSALITNRLAIILAITWLYFSAS